VVKDIRLCNNLVADNQWLRLRVLEVATLSESGRYSFFSKIAKLAFFKVQLKYEIQKSVKLQTILKNKSRIPSFPDPGSLIPDQGRFHLIKYRSFQ
jgi:hypothetical protein